MKVVTIDQLDHNLREINGLNQRGGRMLSVVDLVFRGTMTIEMAAYAIVSIHHGASFLVCAMPGGAGKTTIMGAFLGVLPARESIQSVPSAAKLPSIKDGLRAGKQACLVVHEIGVGAWHGYLSGKAVIEYLSLKSPSTRIVSNIHADTIQDINVQMVSFGGNEIDACAFNLVLFIGFKPGPIGQSRIITHVFESMDMPEGPAFKEVFNFNGEDTRCLGGKYHNHQTALTAAERFIRERIEQQEFLIEQVMERALAFHANLNLL
jgi:hypothetical protein